MAKFAPCERETIIILNDESCYASISTHQRKIHRLIARLACNSQNIINPTLIRKYDEDTIINVSVPSDWISIRPQRNSKTHRGEQITRMCE